LNIAGRDNATATENGKLIWEGRGSIGEYRVGTRDRKALFAMDIGSLNKTIDGGKSWEKLNLGDENHIFHLKSTLTINPDRANEMFAGCEMSCDDNLAHTIDGGATWQYSSLMPQFGADVFQVFFGNNLERDVYAVTSMNSLIFRSQDAGKHWQNISPGPSNTMYSYATTTNVPNELLALVLSGPQNDAKLFQSPDGGSTWTPLTVPQDVKYNWRAHVIPNPYNQNEIILTTPFEAYRSFNHGQSWEKMEVGS